MRPGDELPDDLERIVDDICPDCAGSGERNGGECPTCQGTGQVADRLGGTGELGEAAGGA
jgi:DnaJ-class molecular chaperone